MQWKYRASCRGLGFDVFFDGYTDNKSDVDKLCQHCPVRDQCLEAGIANNENGVWGGVYLVNGAPDDNKNSHKTDEDWESIIDAIQ